MNSRFGGFDSRELASFVLSWCPAGDRTGLPDKVKGSLR
jgi:hypothetical protein